MARKGGGGSAGFNPVDTLFGFMLGMGADYAHHKLLGTGEAVFNDPELDMFDVLEMGGVAMMLLIGITGDSRAKFLIPAGIGAGFAQLYTKIISEKVPFLPRYIIQDKV